MIRYMDREITLAQRKLHIQREKPYIEKEMSDGNHTFRERHR